MAFYKSYKKDLIHTFKLQPKFNSLCPEILLQRCIATLKIHYSFTKKDSDYNAMSYELARRKDKWEQIYEEKTPGSGIFAVAAIEHL